MGTKRSFNLSSVLLGVIDDAQEIQSEDLKKSKDRKDNIIFKFKHKKLNDPNNKDEKIGPDKLGDDLKEIDHELEKPIIDLDKILSGKPVRFLKYHSYAGEKDPKIMNRAPLKRRRKALHVIHEHLKSKHPWFTLKPHDFVVDELDQLCSVSNLPQEDCDKSLDQHQDSNVDGDTKINLDEFQLKVPTDNQIVVDLKMPWSENVPCIEESAANDNKIYKDIRESLKTIEYQPPVCFVNWETKIFVNRDDYEQYKSSRDFEYAKKHAGWIPSVETRSWRNYLMNEMVLLDPSSPQAILYTNMMSTLNRKLSKDSDSNKNDSFTLFTSTNCEILSNSWVDNIIFGLDDHAGISKFCEYTLNRNPLENPDLHIEDSLYMLGEYPEHMDVRENPQSAEQKYVEAMISNLNQSALPEKNNNNIFDLKSFFNVSNDEFYKNIGTPKSEVKRDSSGLRIQHALPAIDLQRSLFPPFLSPPELRVLHRTPLYPIRMLQMSSDGFYTIKNILKHINRKAKERQEIMDSAGEDSEYFHMRTLDDLTATDGTLFLMEYSEEHPPLMSNIGMNSRVINYISRSSDVQASEENELKIGDRKICDGKGIFLFQIPHGHTIMVIENFMFRAPIFKHTPPSTDFIVIRNSTGYFIREITHLFVVSQLCPKIEVFPPNSKTASRFSRDLLQCYIYKCFWRSKDIPRRLKTEQISKIFKQHSENNIRKRLKFCADYRRSNQNASDSNWWVLRGDFRLPSDEEMRAIVTPEAACCYYSMKAAERRLKDNGYVDKNSLCGDDDGENINMHKYEPEVLNAPWHTTKAYIQAMNGRCIFDANGIADPTGCGEGFSYVRVPLRASLVSTNNRAENVPKEIASFNSLSSGMTSANLIGRFVPSPQPIRSADLETMRKVESKFLKRYLYKHGILPPNLEKMQRFELISRCQNFLNRYKDYDVFNTIMGLNNVRSRNPVASIPTSKITPNIGKFQEKCQTMYDIQTRIYSSTEVYSSDEDDDDGNMDMATANIDDFAKDLEMMLSSKKDRRLYSMESARSEEEARKELMKLLEAPLSSASSKKTVRSAQNDISAGTDSSQVHSRKDPQSEEALSGKHLRIHRVFTDGQVEYERTEVVTDPKVISAYLRVVTKESGDFNSNTEDKQEKNSFPLRFLQRESSSSKNQPDFSDSSNAIYRSRIAHCTICGEKGHTKNSKLCQKSGDKHHQSQVSSDQVPSQNISSKSSSKSLNSPEVHHAGKDVACSDQNLGLITTQDNIIVTDEDIQRVEKNVAKSLDDDVMKVQGTKLVVGKAIFKAAQSIQKKSVTITIKKDTISSRMNRAIESKSSYDYLIREYRINNRRRTDPAIGLNLIFEHMINRLKDVPDSWPFHSPVCAKSVPDYYNIIKNPMDFTTIKENAKNLKYHHRMEFLDHLDLIRSNCKLYNGEKHPFSLTATKIYEAALELIDDKDSQIYAYETEINPLLDDDPQVGLSWLFESFVMQLRSEPNTWPFHAPVNIKLFPDYLDIVTTPMDLETIKSKVDRNHYQTHEEFMKDVNLILENSQRYNGADHAYTKAGQSLVDRAYEMLNQHIDNIRRLEEDLSNKNETASGVESSVAAAAAPPTTSGVKPEDAVVNVDSGEFTLLNDLELSPERPSTSESE